MIFQSLSPKERKTFVIHTFYTILEGSMAGIVAMNEFIFLKNLNGKKLLLGLMFQIPQMVLFLAIFSNEIIRRQKNKKKFTFIYILLTRLPILTIIFFPKPQTQPSLLHQYWFLTIILFYFLSMPIMFPTITMFLRNVYSPKHFGKLYSYSTTVGKTVLIFSTFSAGFMLEKNSNLYKILYVYIVVAGISAVAIFMKVPFTDTLTEAKISFFKSIEKSITRMFNVLKTNKAFLYYQIAFMLYGIAFMSTESIIPIYLKEIFSVSYSGLAIYKNIYNIINILFMPFFGAVVDKMDPRKFSSISFAALFVSLFLFFLAQFVPIKIEFFNQNMNLTLVLAYIFYGLFAATMGIAWYISSAYFCKPQDSADYQSVHMTMTGIRGLFAPLMGVILLRYIDFEGVFLLACAFLISSIVLMLHSAKKHLIFSK